jgi:hypothetical protein
MSKKQETEPGMEELSRRSFWGTGSVGLATAALASLAANAQERTNIARAEQDHSESNLGLGSEFFGSWH